jgi:DUF1365 family protein
MGLESFYGVWHQLPVQANLVLGTSGLFQGRPNNARLCNRRGQQNYEAFIHYLSIDEWRLVQKHLNDIGMHTCC